MGSLGETSPLQPSAPLGSTYVSKSGVEPQQYKAFSTEYGSEYKSKDSKLHDTTQLAAKHQTQDAMKEARFQFAGYPQGYPTYQYKQSSPTSLTKKGQIMPNYETNVKGY